MVIGDPLFINGHECEQNSDGVHYLARVCLGKAVLYNLDDVSVAKQTPGPLSRQPCPKPVPQSLKWIGLIGESGAFKVYAPQHILTKTRAQEHSA